MEIGRNERCWCGSTRKFKHCHLNKSSNPAEFLRSLEKDALSEFSKGDCLCPRPFGDCSDQAIASHSLQRRQVLSTIATNGHVKTLDIELDQFQYESRKPPRVVTKSVGLSKASTFPGFCSYHDTTVFGPIENRAWALAEDSAFLLSYRALCREYFSRRARLRTSLRLRRGLEASGNTDQAVRHFFKNEEDAARLGLRRLKKAKLQYDKALLRSSFEQTQYFGIIVTPSIPVLVSGGCLFEYDFHGHQIQNPQVGQVDSWCTYTAIPYGSGGLHLFSWMNQDKVAESFIESLVRIPKSRIGDAMVRYAFEFLETTYFDQRWWDGLSKEKKEMLIQHATSGTHLFPRRANCLCDDQLTYVQVDTATTATNIDRLM